MTKVSIGIKVKLIIIIALEKIKKALMIMMVKKGFFRAISAERKI